MQLDTLRTAMEERFGTPLSPSLLHRELSSLVVVGEGGQVSLSPLQLCARDIKVVLGEVGRLPVIELEGQYEAKFGREMPLLELGFDSVTDLLASLSETLAVRGRGIRKIVCLQSSPVTFPPPSLPPQLPHAVTF